MKFKNKITNKKINQNCLLLSEEKENSLNTKININSVDDFLKFNPDCDLYFDSNFDCIQPSVFYILIRNNHLFLKDVESEKNYFSILSLKDAFRRKINQEIDKLLKQVYSEISKIKNNKLNEYIKCQYCKKARNNDTKDFIYIKKKKFFNKVFS